ncbi:MAG: metal dependent phosphohydrolase [Haloplasmataceae bacterium]|jgi:putative nucleotidyltransferase with HDIG domain|nr:metal dependent phosphohydrolase [Haloplasmataceae bacterium]
MNCKGLYISNDGKSLDKAILDDQKIDLIAAGDGVEIMIQEIEAGIPFIISSAEGTNLMEFFYLLDGELDYLPNNETPTKVKTGDFFYTKKLENSCLFKTTTYVKMLYVSTQPMFHYLGESLKELYKFNKDIGLKDKYTHGHSERVRDYSLKIALEMGLERDSIFRITLAALFHDVGKINVPDEILKKPGKLNDEEYEIMKLHVNSGKELVKKIKYTDISYIVEQHHERLDGSGYPKGLKNDEISIEAKIIAVADTFDTMTTERPYRHASTVNEAIYELIKYTGIHFDKNVVDTFIKYLKKENII